jgi:hypothetical protein
MSKKCQEKHTTAEKCHEYYVVVQVNGVRLNLKL